MGAVPPTSCRRLDKVELLWFLWFNVETKFASSRASIPGGKNTGQGDAPVVYQEWLHVVDRLTITGVANRLAGHLGILGARFVNLLTGTEQIARRFIRSGGFGPRLHRM